MLITVFVFEEIGFLGKKKKAFSKSSFCIYHINMGYQLLQSGYNF